MAKLRIHLAICFGVVLALVLSISCDLPDTERELEGPIPAVWAIFSPNEQLRVFITRVSPYEFGDSIDFYAPPRFVHDASISLSWDGGTIGFRETLFFEYGEQSYAYVPVDECPIMAGRTYELTGNTSIGNFEEIFAVPHIPEVWVSAETAYFSYSSDWAFIMSIPKTGKSFEIFVNKIATLGDWIPYSGEWYEYWWSDKELPDTIGISWSCFDSEGIYELVVCVGDEHYYEYAKTYKYWSDSDDEDYAPPPGGNGYIGVIGSYVEFVDTVWVFLPRDFSYGLNY